MIKMRQKETATNLVYFYNLDTIKSLDELGVWFVGVSSISDLTIRRIQLIDSSDKNAEGAGSTEIDIAIARNNLANCIREVHADTVSISTFYKGVSIVIGVDCNGWTLSIVANKKDKDALDALENLLTTINKKKGDLEMAEDVRETVSETSTPTDNVEQSQQIPVEGSGEQAELLTKLDAVQQALATLQQSFDDKIAEDAHKNGLFDNMHRELVRYQNGALDKIVDTIALDIIQLVDTTKGHVRVYEKKGPTEENYKKLLRIVKGIAEDLEDILYRQNIESYRVPGHEVDVRRQKIIQTLPTDDKSKDNLVAVRVADGYEKGDKVLRPERIKIFKYEAPPETPSEN